MVESINNAGRALAAEAQSVGQHEILSILFLTWLVSGAALAVTLGRQPLVGALVAVAWIVLGTALLAALLWNARAVPSRRLRVVQSVLVLAGAFLFDPLTRFADRLEPRLQLIRARESYDHIAAHAESLGEARGEHELAGIRYVVEPGPPLRIAFPLSGGLLDNWCALVFDPSEDVMSVNHLGVARSEHPSLVALFGGDLVACEELDRPYYHCCFT